MTSPFGPLVLIANPNAGRGTVDRALSRIESVLADENLSYRIVRTTHPGHATEAARQALRDGERYLVAVGGDGTVHEVVNGMVENGGPLAADAVLGVVAAGSGCDFVRSFGLPGDAVQAAAHLAGNGSARSTWAPSRSRTRASPGPGASSTSPRPAWAARWWRGRPGSRRAGSSAAPGTRPGSG